MHIKIYFSSKPLFLTDSIDKELEAYTHHDDTVLIDELSSASINSMIHEMKLQKIHSGILLHSDLKALKKAFFKKFHCLTAGGGLIVNRKKQLLFIKRRGKWDLPKGKQDPGEAIEDCALREVKEETGLMDVSVKKHLLTTYHTYDENGRSILKDTHWFLMKMNGDQQPLPQTEEDITSIVWAESNQIKEYLQNSFPSIIDVIEKYQSS